MQTSTQMNVDADIRLPDRAAKVTRPTTCACGAALTTAPPTGRPRRHCSPACRRRWQNQQRKLARINDALEQWRAVRLGDFYSRAFIRQRVQELKTERAALLVGEFGERLKRVEHQAPRGRPREHRPTPARLPNIDREDVVEALMNTGADPRSTRAIIRAELREAERAAGERGGRR